jgi:hypothetical protein
MTRNENPSPTPWRSSLLMALGLCAGLAACNQHEMFRLVTSEQVSFSNEVDILFVVDNSASMWDEAADLIGNFDVFITTMASSEAQNPTTETLADAVDNYLSETQNRGRNMDYRIAITTASVDPTKGWTTRIDPGEAGTLVGDAPVFAKGDENLAYTFRETLACQATCWDKDDALENDDAYTGEAGDCYLPDQGVTADYLDCLCIDAYEDPQLWWNTNNICYSGTEQHMESAALALCRAVNDPPETCWDNLPTSQSPDEAIGSNLGFLRPGVKTFVVIVSDAGDQSQRFETGESSAHNYVALFESLGLDVTVVVVGPPYICDEEGSCSLDCNSGGSSPNEIQRLQSAVEMTGGAYYYIAEPAGSCDNGVDDDGDGLTDGSGGDPDCVGDGSTTSGGGDHECFGANFEQNLADMGKLLIDLQTAFKLQTIPDESTIQVYVDDEAVSKADKSNESGDYTQGWSYDPAQNAVVFWGSDVPAYNADVRIYYRPLEGKPRDFPL